MYCECSRFGISFFVLFFGLHSSWWRQNDFKYCFCLVKRSRFVSFATFRTVIPRTGTTVSSSLQNNFCLKTSYKEEATFQKIVGKRLIKYWKVCSPNGNANEVRSRRREMGNFITINKYFKMDYSQLFKLSWFNYQRRSHLFHSLNYIITFLKEIIKYSETRF